MYKVQPIPFNTSTPTRNIALDNFEDAADLKLHWLSFLQVWTGQQTDGFIARDRRFSENCIDFTMLVHMTFMRGFYNRIHLKSVYFMASTERQTYKINIDQTSKEIRMQSYNRIWYCHKYVLS